MQPIKQPKPFPCENCTKSFKSGNGLKYHLNKVHSDKEPQHIRLPTLDLEDEPKTKTPKSVPAALALNEETSLPGQMDLLTEFALIATSPQSPLMQKCKGSQFEISNSWEQHRTSPSPDISKPNTPPPQLMDPRTSGLFSCASETSTAVQSDSLVSRSLTSDDRRDSWESADSAQFSHGCPSPCDDMNKFDFTAVDSTAALTLSIMAKDRIEHNQRSKLIRTTPVENEVSTLKRTSSMAELDRDKTKRPMNAFMLFAKRFRVEITQAHPGKDNRAISVILGDKWKGMKQDERKEYVQEAKLLAEEHKRINPDCWKRKRTQGRHQVTNCRRF